MPTDEIGDERRVTSSRSGCWLVALCVVGCSPDTAVTSFSDGGAIGTDAAERDASDDSDAGPAVLDGSCVEPAFEPTTHSGVSVIWPGAVFDGGPSLTSTVVRGTIRIEGSDIGGAYLQLGAPVTWGVSVYPGPDFEDGDIVEMHLERILRYDQGREETVAVFFDAGGVLRNAYWRLTGSPAQLHEPDSPLPIQLGELTLEYLPSSCPPVLRAGLEARCGTRTLADLVVQSSGGSSITIGTGQVGEVGDFRITSDQASHYELQFPSCVSHSAPFHVRGHATRRDREPRDAGAAD